MFSVSIEKEDSTGDRLMVTRRSEWLEDAIAFAIDGFCDHLIGMIAAEAENKAFSTLAKAMLSLAEWNGSGEWEAVMDLLEEKTKADTKADTRPEDCPMAWFAIMERAREEQDSEQVAAAIQQLRRLGVEVALSETKKA